MEIEPLYNFLEILKSSDKTQQQIEKDKISLKTFYESVQTLLEEKSVTLFDSLVHKHLQLELLKCLLLPEDQYQKLPVGIQRIKVCGSIYGLLFRIISNWSTFDSIKEDAEIQKILEFFKEKLTISTTEIKYKETSPPIVITRSPTAESQTERPLLVEKYGIVVLSYLFDIFETNRTRSMHTRSGSPKIAAPVQSGGEKRGVKRAKSFVYRTYEQESSSEQTEKQKNIFGYECTYVWLIRYITDVTGSPDVFLGLLDGLLKDVVEQDPNFFQSLSEMVSHNDKETKDEILLQLYLGQGFKNEGMEGLLKKKFNNSVERFLYLQKTQQPCFPENYRNRSPKKSFSVGSSSNVFITK